MSDIGAVIVVVVVVGCQVLYVLSPKLVCLSLDLLNNRSPERGEGGQTASSQKISQICAARRNKYILHACPTFPASVCLCAGQHPVDSVGVAASLPAVFSQLTDVGQGIQGTAEICLPRLWVWFIFAWTVPPWSEQAKGQTFCKCLFLFDVVPI